ncbi:Uncharacterised protein [Bordetella pertussis]|nr:Uncharacterised protein [Bordetella pertussis]
MGRDVVPDVYIRRTRSVSATAACGGISRPGWPSRRESAWACASMTILGVSSATMASNSSSTSSSLAPASPRI